MRASAWFRPRKILVLVQRARSQLDAPPADHRFGIHRALPARFPAAVERLAVDLSLQTHGAFIFVPRAVGLIQDHFGIGDGQASAADATALMAFDHRQIFSPLAMAEITEHIAHLHVVFIDARLSHI